MGCRRLFRRRPLQPRASLAVRRRRDGARLVVAARRPLPLSDPAGVDPEEALVASVSSCHMLWFLSLAQEAGWDIARYADTARGRMGRDDRGKIAVTRITLKPEIAFAGNQPSADELAALHHAAHEACFIANSLRTEIVIER